MDSSSSNSRGDFQPSPSNQVSQDVSSVSSFASPQSTARSSVSNVSKLSSAGSISGSIRSDVSFDRRSNLSSALSTNNCSSSNNNNRSHSTNLHKSRLQNASRNVLNNTTTSNEWTGLFSNDVIMSIVEGRGKAKGEIGLAYIDLNSPTLNLAQFMDNCSFDSLKMKCHVCLPVEIIYPHTLSENNMMLAALVENFANIDFKSFDRRFFNEKKGFEFVQTLCYKDYTGIDIELESKYYCLSACSALLQYIFTNKKIQYAPKSMMIVFQSSLDTMIIDPISARILELLINLSNPKSSDTLFGSINRTKTKSGYVLLRSSIMQPSTDLELITKRLDMIEAISNSIEVFNNFEMILTSLSTVDLDQLLVNMVQNHNVSNISPIRLAEKKIELVIHIKHVISLVDQLRQTLESCDSPVFRDYIEQLKDVDFKSIQEMIDQTINNDTKYTKGSANMKLEKCFAIKDRFNALLDVSRGIYSDTIEDVIALVKTYDTIKIGNSNSRGFFMQIKHNRNQPFPKLPSIFCDINVTKSTISCTTEDLMKLNNRIAKSIEEIYFQSDCIITKLINDIRSKISCFYVLTDIVANVDLVFSFAYQSSCFNYSRPIFGDYIETQNGTHPVLDKISISVPNSISINNDLNFHIITGPNMSGKTTFLKQTALLQIMAQIGSFVPAEYAMFRICDKLFTRMGLNDNLQMNSSSFMVEVKELNYILSNLTENSLILIDELGRGSVVNETLSVCWAICESLLSAKAYTLFATHFIELTSLAKVYLNVTNYHFSSEIVEGNLVCKYPHILLPGPTRERFYGIELAQLSGLDPAIVQDARNIALRLSSANANTTEETHSEEIILRRAKYRLAARLIHLIINKQEELDIDLIRRLQGEFEGMKQIESLYE